MLAALEHPNIEALYDFQHVDGECSLRVSPLPLRQVCHDLIVLTIGLPLPLTRKAFAFNHFPEYGVVVTARAVELATPTGAATRKLKGG